MRCETCGEGLSGARRRWCSKRCNDAWRHKVRSKPLECRSCGRTVLVAACEWARRKYCSKLCADRHYNTTFLRGARNGRWRGGRALSYGQNWKRIKTEVRARDRVCRHCGKTPEGNGRALDVHHLRPFRFSGDNSHDNLVALCRTCHMRADDHGRKGSARFLALPAVKRPTKRELRRLRRLIRAAEARARRKTAQRIALDRHAEGGSLREIARAVGYSHETVNQWLRGHHRVEERAPAYAAREHAPGYRRRRRARRLAPRDRALARGLAPDRRELAFGRARHSVS